MAGRLPEAGTGCGNPSGAHTDEANWNELVREPFRQASFGSMEAGSREPSTMHLAVPISYYWRGVYWEIRAPHST
jgi:hypothetical protein